LKCLSEVLYSFSDTYRLRVDRQPTKSIENGEKNSLSKG